MQDLTHLESQLMDIKAANADAIERAKPDSKPEIDYSAYADMAEFLDMVGRYTRLVPLFDRMVGVCPFHQEKTPSFIVFPKTKKFLCFGCGIDGTDFDFIDEIAARKIGRRIVAVTAREFMGTNFD